MDRPHAVETTKRHYEAYTELEPTGCQRNGGRKIMWRSMKRKLTELNRT